MQIKLRFYFNLIIRNLGYLILPLPGMLDDQKGGNLKKDKMCISKYLLYVTYGTVFIFSTNILKMAMVTPFFAVNKVADFSVIHSDIARNNKSYLHTRLQYMQLRYL